MSAVHTCVVQEGSAIDVHHAVASQQLDGPRLESIVVGEGAVLYGEDSVVGKDSTSSGLSIVYESGVLKGSSAILEDDGTVTILHKVGKV